MSTSKVNTFFESLHNVTSETTERKSPTSQSSTSGSQQSTFYNPDPKKETSATEDPAQQPPQPTNRLTEDQCKASGKTAAHMTSGAIETVFTLTERLVFLFSFSKSERETITLLDEKEASQYTEKERQVNRKFLAISKKHDKIRDRIPLPPKDVDCLAEGFTEHARITGQALNPQVIIWSTIIRVLANRGIDIFL